MCGILLLNTEKKMDKYTFRTTQQIHRVKKITNCYIINAGCTIQRTLNQSSVQYKDLYHNNHLTQTGTRSANFFLLSVAHVIWSDQWILQTKLIKYLMKPYFQSKNKMSALDTHHNHTADHSFVLKILNSDHKQTQYALSLSFQTDHKGFKPGIHLAK